MAQARQGVNIAETRASLQAIEDWEKIAAGKGSADAFLKDLAELRKIKNDKNPGRSDAAADFKFISATLRQQAVMPNLEILGSAKGHVIGRDIERKQKVMISVLADGMVQVDDVRLGPTGIEKLQTKAQKLDLLPSHIKASDVHQGNEINDCRLMARLASLAKEDPAAIARMIKDNNNGTYTVKFPGAERAVTINAPTPWERATFTSGGAEWTLILGKAYRSLDHIPFGPPRSAADVDSLLTNKKHAVLTVFKIVDCTKSPQKPPAASEICDSGFTKARNFAGSVSKWVDQNSDHVSILEHRNVGVLLRDSLRNHMIVNAAFMGNNVVASDKSSLSGPLTGRHVKLQSGHEYSILGFDTRKQTVTLRNPWAVNFEIGTKKQIGNGLVEVALKDFNQAVMAIEIERTRKSS